MHYRATVTGFLMVVGLAWASHAAAWPASSRGQQFLPITVAECLIRAEDALEAERMNEGAYGGGNFLAGSRGPHTAVITCNDAVRGGVVVNIFVASDPGQSGDQAGAVRQTLQRYMESGAPPAAPVTPPVAPTAGCGWVNGNDSRGGSDYGRGTLDPAGHRNHILTYGAGVAPGIISQRLEVLRGCLSTDAYARLYADASVLIAGYGRSRLGWIDAQDGRFSTDTGRGISNWQAHYDWAAGGSAGQVPATVANRVAEINGRVPVDVAAQMYAELSVLIARYGGSR